MPSRVSRPMTVRVRNDLYDRAALLADVQGVSIRKLVESGLETELSRQLKAGGSPLRRALEAVGQIRGVEEEAV